MPYDLFRTRGLVAVGLLRGFKEGLELLGVGAAVFLQDGLTLIDGLEHDYDPLAFFGVVLLLTLFH